MLSAQGHAAKLLLKGVRVARHPAAAVERFRNRMDRRLEYSRPPPVYRPEPDWPQRLHQQLGLPFPCPIAAEFRQRWPEIAALVTAKGVRFGPESFYGYNDGDPAFVGAVWCLVRHLRPANVIETGVAHGISTRFILEALERNGRGELWSIDPPPVEPGLAAEVGIAVDGFASERWHLVTGTSRRMLPRLLSRLGRVELFVHDSLHTRRNVCFEVEHALQAIPAGGFAVIDDIDTNAGFRTLMAERPGDRFLVCEADPVRPDQRRFNQKGLFGIMQIRC